MVQPVTDVGIEWMVTDEEGEEHFFDTEGEALDFEYEKSLVD